MNGTAKILAVDDDLFMHAIVEEMLGIGYQVVFSDDGASALEIAEKESPDLILLDVELPDVDGYTLCRQLKGGDATADIPVIFVSAHDQIEDRLKGYEAGGQDYVVKPFHPQELVAKVEHLLRMLAERGRIQDMADSASRTAITSMSEMGGLLDALKKLNACQDCLSLADALVSSLASYGLNGAVQVRMPGETLTRTGQGEASPLEVSVISHMAGMERMVRFKSRISINYEHVTLLVNDMPVDDDERCSRLCNHLTMLAEGAEARIGGVMSESGGRQRSEAVEQAAGRIAEALAAIDNAQRQNQIAAGIAVQNLAANIDRAYLRLGLTNVQETHLDEILRAGIDNILDSQSSMTDLQNNLTAIVKHLEAMSGGG